jgi:hypothetical protein
MRPTKSTSKSPEVLEVHSDWHILLMTYLGSGGLPDDKDEHERLCCWVGHYTLINDELFLRSANSTLMRCVSPDEGCTIL